jgi:hypothetical protein
VAIAALAATFWLGVATLRLIIHPPAPHRAAPVVPAATPPPSVVSGVSAAAQAPISDPCGIPEWPHVRREGPLTYRDVRCGIAAAKPQMWACQRRFPDESFHAHARVGVARSGRVSSAKFVRGPAGSPLAACLEAAMKSVTYPKSAYRYEFMLAWMGLE